MSTFSPFETQKRPTDGGLQQNTMLQFLTFAVGDERYAVEISNVREILGIPPIAKSPQARDYLKGVIDLRGTIIPVVDFRMKIGIEERAYDSRTCILVVNVRMSGQSVPVGLVVDTVVDVLKIGEKELQPAPNYGSSVDTSFLDGIVKVGPLVVMAVNIDRLLESATELVFYAGAR